MSEDLSIDRDERGEIPYEEMVWILDVMIAELYMGFERRHVKGTHPRDYTGFQWRLKPESVPEGVRLPDHVQRLRKWQPGVVPLVSERAGFTELFTLLNTTADRSGWSYQVVRSPAQLAPPEPDGKCAVLAPQRYIVMLGTMVIGEHGGGFRAVVTAEAADVQVAIGVALALAKQESWQAWHRKLFPAAYLKLASG